MDPRLCCKFCFKNQDISVLATKIAPQHDGGDDDQPAVWVPVCDDHFEDWFDGVLDSERLPVFEVPRPFDPSTFDYSKLSLKVPK